MAGLDNSGFTLSPVCNAVEFVEMIYDNGPVTAGLIVRMRVVLVRVGGFPLRGKEGEVQIGAEPISA